MCQSTSKIGNDQCRAIVKNILPSWLISFHNGRLVFKDAHISSRHVYFQYEQVRRVQPTAGIVSSFMCLKTPEVYKDILNLKSPLFVIPEGLLLVVVPSGHR
jgi:hypothetical protein